jgi:hypothetical protein
MAKTDDFKVIYHPRIELAETHVSFLRTLITTGQSDPVGSVVKYVEHLLLLAYAKGKEDQAISQRLDPMTGDSLRYDPVIPTR